MRVCSVLCAAATSPVLADFPNVDEDLILLYYRKSATCGCKIIVELLHNGMAAIQQRIDRVMGVVTKTLLLFAAHSFKSCLSVGPQTSSNGEIIIEHRLTA